MAAFARSSTLPKRRGVAVGVVWLLAVGVTLASAAPYPNGTILIGQIHVNDPGVVDMGGLLSQDDTFALAVRAVGSLVDPSKPHSSQLAVITDDVTGDVSDAGTIRLAIDHRLSWLFRFTGKAQPTYGGRTIDGSPMSEHVKAATELNVVIDASSGAVLTMFSFQ